MHVELTCPYCNTQFDIRQTSLVAPCPSCDRLVFTSEAAVQPNNLPQPTTQARKDALYNHAVPKPRRFRVTETDKALYIEWVWRNTVSIILGLFGFIWSFALLSNISDVVGNGIQILDFVYTVLLAISLAFAYHGLTSLLNRTRITINPNRILIQSFPLPVIYRQRVYPVDAIIQIYVRRDTHRPKRGNTTSRYILMVELKSDGVAQQMLHELEDPNYALYLEREIEAFLGIDNREISFSYTG